MRNRLGFWEKNRYLLGIGEYGTATKIIKTLISKIYFEKKLPPDSVDRFRDNEIHPLIINLAKLLSSKIDYKEYQKCPDETKVQIQNIIAQAIIKESEDFVGEFGKGIIVLVKPRSIASRIFSESEDSITSGDRGWDNLDSKFINEWYFLPESYQKLDSILEQTLPKIQEIIIINTKGVDAKIKFEKLLSQNLAGEKNYFCLLLPELNQLVSTYMVLSIYANEAQKINGEANIMSNDGSKQYR